ncbi:hypothetical protein [Tahibacter sp.]|uniref:hypothetical protein n=1 Tax=Tahibacter sp. TaxID=2056211 RepID=UPI0028C3C261|nr:hypothetical protein [Tahibacter sp.]
MASSAVKKAWLSLILVLPLIAMGIAASTRASDSPVLVWLRAYWWVMFCLCTLLYLLLRGVLYLRERKHKRASRVKPMAMPGRRRARR